MSLVRLEEHRRLWAAQPVLRRVYEVWFDQLLEAVRGSSRILEIGAGPGFLSEHARARTGGWLATDIIPTPWNDVAADALRLPFRDASVDAVVGIDFIHHLARPERFFRETARVLRPGGRLAVIEPWVTPFSYPIYRFLHQEGCRLGLDPWAPFHDDPAKDAFDGDGAVPWLLARRTTAEQWSGMGLRPPAIQRINAFAYLLTLGFRPGSLLPGPLVAPLLAADRWTQPLAALLALRALMVWQKAGLGKSNCSGRGLPQFELS